MDSKINVGRISQLTNTAPEFRVHNTSHKGLGHVAAYLDPETGRIRTIADLIQENKSLKERVRALESKNSV